ncbi:MAG: lysophospholipase L1-like esterase [Verrucomicrobiales bacterium]|jgi:lysophospholipase L1-like esterase
MAQRHRKLAFGIITFALMAIIGIALLEVVLRVTAEQRGNATFLLGKRWHYLTPIGIPESMPSIAPQAGAYRGYDPDLGWSIGRLGRGEEVNMVGKGDPTIYFSNIYGYRCTRNVYDQEVESWEGRTLPEIDGSHYDYICIGDSFTHGDAVLAEEAWPWLLGNTLGKSIANLGVGGYGIDQAVMRYEKRNPSCDNVVLGLISGDLERAANLIYNFTFGDFKSKPIYEFENDSTTVFNRPALHGDALLAEYRSGAESDFFKRAEHSWDSRQLRRSFFDFSYGFRTLKSIPVWHDDRTRSAIYRTEGQSLDYCLQILQHLKQLTENRDANLTIVLLGSGYSQDVEEKADSWALFKGRLDAANLQWIDTVSTIQGMYNQDPASVVSTIDNVHYTPEANAKIAEMIANEFSQTP